MSHDEPAGRVAARPGLTSPSSGSWNRWPPPAATSSHDQFFSVVKKARPEPPVGGISILNKPAPGQVSSSTPGSKLKSGAPRPGPSKAPISLLKTGPLRMGVAVPAGNAAKTGLPRPAPSSIAVPSSKSSMPRPGPPASTSPKARHPSAGAVRSRVPSGGASLPAPDAFRPKPSASAPKPRMSWDLDLLTDGSPEDDGDFASDLEQSPAFLTKDFDSRPRGAPSMSILDRVKSMGPTSDKARVMFPKGKRGRPPKAPGDLRVPRKYVKKNQAANGASGHTESVGVLYTKPKWKGATETLHNEFGKMKEKQRRRKEKLIAVRMDGSVPQVVTLLPKDPANPTGPVLLVSPGKDVPQPKIVSPLGKLSGGSANELTHGKPETKPLFEHIDEDWAVIKKSLENTDTKERKLSEAGSSAKASSVTLTPSPAKKSDRSDEISTDDDIGNDLAAPLHNLEKLQDQMIKNLMDDGALAALKKRKKQKEVQMFRKKKMSDYWKSKLGSGKPTYQMKMKRPYTMRPLTSDNVKHMEEAISAVLSAPSPEGSPKKLPFAASGTGSPPKPSADRVPGRVPPLVIRRPPSMPKSQPQPFRPPLPSPSGSQPSSEPTTQPLSQSSPQSTTMSAPRSSVPRSAAPQPPTSAAPGPALVTASFDGLERRAPTEPDSDPAAAARLLQVKQELAARFLSDLHEQRAQLQAAEQQRLVQQQERTAAFAAQQQQQLGWRPLIRVRHRRRRAGQPRVVRLSEASFLAGNSVTDANIFDDEDDGLAPVPVLDSPPPVSMPASKLKEFLDTARVSRFRRTCGSGLLASVEMSKDTPERMVFVSDRPLPPEVEQTIVPTGQGFSLPALSGALWPAEQIDPARAAAAWPDDSPASGVGWYGSQQTPIGATTGWSGGGASPAATAGWFGGVLSPAPGAVWPGRSTDCTVPGTALDAASITSTIAPAAAQGAASTEVTTLGPTAAPEAVPAPDNTSDISMDEKPLQIVLPATPTAEESTTPVCSTPQTPMSVSPRVAPVADSTSTLTATPTDLAGRPPLGGTSSISASVPVTPSEVSPRATSGASTGAPPSPRPVDPESLQFACNRCPTRLETISEQVYHEIRMHMIEENTFRCIGCPMLVPLNGDVSLVLDGLLDHYMKHVDGAGRLLAFDSSGDFFRCEFCPRVFEDPAAYGAHEIQCRSAGSHVCHVPRSLRDG